MCRLSASPRMRQRNILAGSRPSSQSTTRRPAGWLRNGWDGAQPAWANSWYRPGALFRNLAAGKNYAGHCEIARWALIEFQIPDVGDRQLGVDCRSPTSQKQTLKFPFLLASPVGLECRQWPRGIRSDFLAWRVLGHEAVSCGEPPVLWQRPLCSMPASKLATAMQS